MKSIWMWLDPGRKGQEADPRAKGKHGTKMGKEDWNGETMAWRKEPDERRPNPDMVSKYVW